MTILSPTRTTPNFNPRTPRGVRRGPSGSRTAGGNISIHAPRAGRDSASMTHFFASPLFQSTRPMRGATVGPGDIPAIEKPFQSTHPMRGATSNTPTPPIDHGISIHAPHAGRDEESVAMSRDKAIFQSTRPMRGATNSSFQRYFFCHYFNPRAPCGARRRNCNSMGQVHKISIHAPHAGRDCQAAHREPYCTNFNPRAPCGARLPSGP